ILICAYMMYSLPVDTWLRLVVWMVIGLLIYFFYSMNHSRVGNQPMEAAGDCRRGWVALAFVTPPQSAPRFDCVGEQSARPVPYGTRLAENSGVAPHGDRSPAP